MSESWDDYAEDWDSNPDVVKYAELAHESLLEKIDPSGKAVLDFGCGTGLLTEKLATQAQTVVGLDSAQKMIDALNQKGISNISTVAAELTKASIGQSPLEENAFNLITASSVCSFLPDYQGMLSLLASLLKPEGHFVQWDWQATEEYPDFGFNADQIQSAYAKAGLTLISVETAFTLYTEKGDMDVIMAVGQKP